MNSKVLFGVAALLAMMVQEASAHTGVGDASGFMHGVMHPIGGLDHVLAMVTVGLFAAHLGGRALWLVPASFVTMMSLGGVLGIYGVPIPFIEIGIALSVAVLGTAVALQTSLSLTAAMGLVGLFAIFHGHAHGTEMPLEASGLTYAAGFLLATAALHAVGIGLGLAVSRCAQGTARRISQVSGAGIALAGVALLFGAI
jgi:urease accessory protein